MMTKELLYRAVTGAVAEEFAPDEEALVGKTRLARRIDVVLKTAEEASEAAGGAHRSGPENG